MGVMATYRPGRRGAYSKRVPCMYPTCHRIFRVDFASPGRLPLFCSPSCRTLCGRDVRQLENDRAAIDAELRDGPGTRRKRELIAERNVVDWHLQRYHVVPPVRVENVVG